MIIRLLKQVPLQYGGPPGFQPPHPSQPAPPGYHPYYPHHAIPYQPNLALAAPGPQPTQPSVPAQPDVVPARHPPNPTSVQPTQPGAPAQHENQLQAPPSAQSYVPPDAHPPMPSPPLLPSEPAPEPVEPPQTSTGRKKRKTPSQPTRAYGTRAQLKESSNAGALTIRLPGKSK
ncbi:hypothetical protein FRC08_007313 [Ceratobasidium sp. 394]|nr:hypothetical protein FRC08_007313 [Ceratobasidium sp. 394]